MGNLPIPATAGNEKSVATDRPKPPSKKHGPAALAIQLTSHATMEESVLHQAELFYLQKQIQAQTPMVIVLHDGEQVEGCIEWYDHKSLKVRGHTRSLIYKSAIKYMYKVGDMGQ
jgi:sRNA-binding regulator protein Hfq